MKQTVRQTSLHDIKVIVSCYTTRTDYNGKMRFLERNTYIHSG